MNNQRLFHRLPIIIMIGCSNVSIAQIPNAGFESWDSLGCSAWPMVPVNWQSPCSWCCWFVNGLEQSTDAYRGSYAAKLSPSSMGDIGIAIIPSLLQTSFPYDAYPASLSGYYKYSTDSIGDSAVVVVNVFEFDQNLSSYDTLFTDTFKLGPDSVYTRFTFIIPPISSGPLQDSMGISFFSGPSNTYYATGVLYLDSLWFNTCMVYDTVIVTIHDTVTVFDTVAVTDTLIIDIPTGLNPPDNLNRIKAYPNPTDNSIIIDNGDFTLINGFTLKIINSLGQEVFSSPVNTASFVVNLSQFGGGGLYYLRVYNSSNQIIEEKKILLQ